MNNSKCYYTILFLDWLASLVFAGYVILWTRPTCVGNLLGIIVILLFVASLILSIIWSRKGKVKFEDVLFNNRIFDRVGNFLAVTIIAVSHFVIGKVLAGIIWMCLGAVFLLPSKKP